jgi:hypothetical protein
MLEPMEIFNESASLARTFASVTDSCNILTGEVHSLYLFSFLLTADDDKAEKCFLSGLGECVEGVSVFMDWVRSWARRTILKHAIRMVMPKPEHADYLSLGSLEEVPRSGKNNLFASIVALSAFERFVFVMSVLERQSDEDCSILLGCSQRDVMIARELALMRLGNIETSIDQSGWTTRPFAPEELLA